MALDSTKNRHGDDTPPLGVAAVLSRLEQLTLRPQVSARDIVGAFGDAAFLPALMVPALIVVSPLSGIPLLPTCFGLIIALVAVQSLTGRAEVWLPNVLLRQTLSGARLARALHRLDRAARWIDGHAHPRWMRFVVPPFDRVPKALCLVCGAAMPFLELVPFSSSLLGLAVVFLSAALLLQDGLYVLTGAALICFAALVPLAVYGAVLGL